MGGADWAILGRVAFQGPVAAAQWAVAAMERHAVEEEEEDGEEAGDEGTHAGEGAGAPLFFIDAGGDARGQAMKSLAVDADDVSNDAHDLLAGALSRVEAGAAGAGGSSDALESSGAGAGESSDVLEAAGTLSESPAAAEEQPDAVGEVAPAGRRSKRARAAAPDTGEAADPSAGAPAAAPKRRRRRGAVAK